MGRGVRVDEKGGGEGGGGGWGGGGGGRGGGGGGASGSVTVSYGRGIPPGGVKVQERKKGKSKRVEKKGEQVSREMGLKKKKGKKKRRRNGKECCFDVKGDGRAVVRRARGRGRKNKRERGEGRSGEGRRQEEE